MPLSSVLVSVRYSEIDWEITHLEASSNSNYAKRDGNEDAVMLIKSDRCFSFFLLQLLMIYFILLKEVHYGSTRGSRGKD